MCLSNAVIAGGLSKDSRGATRSPFCFSFPNWSVESISELNEWTVDWDIDWPKLQRQTDQTSGINTSLKLTYCVLTLRQIGSLPPHFDSCLERDTQRERESSWLCISDGLKEEKKAIPSIYKTGLQFCRILLGPGGIFENTFLLFHPYQSRLLPLPLPWPACG